MPQKLRRPPPLRQSDPDIAAAGCALGLVFGVIFLLVAAISEGSKYKPKAYKPIAPDVPNDGKSKHFIDELLTATILTSSILGVLSGVIMPRGSNHLAVLLGIAGVACVVYGLKHVVVRQGLKRQSIALSASPDTNTLFSPSLATTYTLYPQPTAANPLREMAWLQGLLAACPRLTFQIVAEPNHVVWQVVDPLGQYDQGVVIAHLRSAQPGVVVEVEPMPKGETLNHSPPCFRQHFLFELANDYAAPLPFLTEQKAYDPLTTLVTRMGYLSSEYNERISYCLQVFVASEVARQRGIERVQKGDIHSIGGALYPEDSTKVDNLHGMAERVLSAKLAGPVYHCFLAVVIESQSRDRLKELAQAAATVLEVHRPGYNRLVLLKPLFATKKWGKIPAWASLEEMLWYDVARDAHIWQHLLLVLHPGEIAALWHLANDTFTTPQIAWAGKPVPASLTGAREDRVQVGVAGGYGNSQPIFVGRGDRAYHLYITGKTGTGKSTLLHHLIHQDIVDGQGVVVLDPHGKLVDDILATSIPGYRAQDVVLLECGHSDYPVPLNPLRVPAGVSWDEAYTLVYWLVRKIYASIWREGRMNTVFQQLIQALLCDPQATFLDIQRLLLDTSYRGRLLARLKQQERWGYAQQNFWEWYLHHPPSGQMDIADPIIARMGAFLGTQTLVNMTCHPYGLPFKQLISQRKVVLINLSGSGIMTETGNIGAMFLLAFYLSSQSLGYLSSGEPPRCYLYVDEVERVITSPLPDMFSQARKFGLSLTLANQYLEQLSDETLQGILGNVGTQVVFEVGEADRRRLARAFEPALDSRELLTLGAHTAVLKTRCEGQDMPAFRMQTLPPPNTRSRVGIEKLRMQTIANYLPLMAHEVRDWLDKRYGGGGQAPPKQIVASSDGLVDFE